MSTPNHPNIPLPLSSLPPAFLIPIPNFTLFQNSVQSSFDTFIHHRIFITSHHSEPHPTLGDAIYDAFSKLYYRLDKCRYPGNVGARVAGEERALFVNNMRKLIDRNDVLGAGYLIPEPEGFVDYERDEPELVRRSVEDWMDMQVEFGRVRVKQEGDDGDGGFEVLETRGEGKPDIASSELLSEVAKDDIEQWSEIAETPSPKTVDDPAVAGPDVEDSETYVEDQLNATASSELSSGMAEDDMERRLEIAETLSPATVDDVIAVPENEDTAVARELPKENDEEQKKSEGDDHDYTTQ